MAHGVHELLWLSHSKRS